MRRRLGSVVSAGSACALLAISGCSGDRDSDEGRKIEAVVKRFSLASGPDACSLMTGKALTTVYGRGSLDPAAARKRCVAESKRFSGEAATVTFVKVNDSNTAHATAKTPGGRFFSVALEKHGGRWLVNGVTPRPRGG
jgi:hypothetical protein